MYCQTDVQMHYFTRPEVCSSRKELHLFKRPKQDKFVMDPSISEQLQKQLANKVSERDAEWDKIHVHCN